MLGMTDILLDVVDSTVIPFLICIGIGAIFYFFSRDREERREAARRKKRGDRSRPPENQEGEGYEHVDAFLRDLEQDRGLTAQQAHDRKVYGYPIQGRRHGNGDGQEGTTDTER